MFTCAQTGLLRDETAEACAYRHRSEQAVRGAEHLKRLALERAISARELEPDEFFTAEQKATGKE